MHGVPVRTCLKAWRACEEQGTTSVPLTMFEKPETGHVIDHRYTADASLSTVCMLHVCMLSKQVQCWPGCMTPQQYHSSPGQSPPLPSDVALNRAFIGVRTARRQCMVSNYGLSCLTGGTSKPHTRPAGRACFCLLLYLLQSLYRIKQAAYQTTDISFWLP